MEAITVTKFNTYIKQIFDSEELLHNISIVGEIFDVSTSRNIMYFSLKDENSTLSCVCFYPAYMSGINEGDSVIVTGSPNYYTKIGKFNFNVVKIEKNGQGKLYEQFLLLKEKLEKEGYFDLAHKKQIPQNIKRIGVITSKEGAVIQDIKNVAWRRNPNVDIVLFNTKVQGKGAENEIAHAIDVFGKYENVDVLVVARGGGSLEDLWAYNTEIVARATYNCPKPIVSAVGHETDWTIIDFVSDLRAPTPSAAAELLTVNMQEKKKDIINLYEKIKKETTLYLYQKTLYLKTQSSLLVNKTDKFLSDKNLKFQKGKIKFLSSCENYINSKSYEIGLIENTLKKNNPIEILNKGYAKIEQKNKWIKSADSLDLKEKIDIIFRDGTIQAKPIAKGENNEN